MDFSNRWTDASILAEVGARLSSERLSRNLTQAQLAHDAGVSKRTVERIEAGQSAQLTSFIRILRTLDLLEGLDRLLPPPQPSPMELLRHHGRTPKRASSGRAAADRPWTWGEDS